MDMQDNEFDNLFRSKLEDFATEPSGKVWKGIDDELGAGKRRKIALMPFLSVAASIIVLIMAGILFIPHKTKVIKNQPAKNQLALNDQHAKTSNAIKTTISAQTGQLLTGKANPVKQVAKLHRGLKSNSIAPQNNGLIAKQNDPAKAQSQLVLAAVTQKHEVIVQPVKIDTATALADASVAQQTVKPDVVAAAIVPVPVKADMIIPAKKHRLRSIGDVLNVVIAAVDKRKDKIIEFSDTDDDESSITAVNLGVFKIKSQSK